MKLAILGSGAMGSVFGGRLSLAGHDVTLVDVWREHMDAVAERGLVLEAPGGVELHAHPKATADPAELEPVDAVIVLTKGYATEEAARSIAHAVGPETSVVTLQNGLGLDAILAGVFGAERVVPGTTTVGALMVEPGRSKMTPQTATGEAVTHIGAPAGGLAGALAEASLPTEIRDDVEAMIWTKLTMAASMAPATAVLGCSIGEVWGDDDGRTMIRSIFDEIVAVAAADGVELDAGAVWLHCTATWDNCMEHCASMAIDVKNGRRTEIDNFSLEIARRARLHGVEAGGCEALGRLVRLAERAQICV